MLLQRSTEIEFCFQYPYISFNLFNTLVAFTHSVSFKAKPVAKSVVFKNPLSGLVNVSGGLGSGPRVLIRDSSVPSKDHAQGNQSPKPAKVKPASKDMNAAASPSGSDKTHNWSREHT
ncbi:hypothetical protein FRX31_002840 [Thalictrum thalictroides]|uniref:Uncharacterized protein n=1 Tax=Thalictrum thalictroides TaxID=46969 RepID=A0A7J6XGE7_THATH|nr:hypothetical protein FRX31_002840 [Thalictrum thalictroides]